jgi:hypothetical protein
MKKKMQTHQATNEGLALLSIIDWAEKKDLDLPSDLSEKHDEYLWEKSQ